MACGGITTIIDQWNCNCNAGVPAEQFPTHQPKQDITFYSYYLLCTYCTTLLYINVINVMYTNIMLCTIKPTYLMTVYCLRGAAPIGFLFVKKVMPVPPQPPALPQQCHPLHRTAASPPNATANNCGGGQLFPAIAGPRFLFMHAAILQFCAFLLFGTKDL